MALVDFMTEPDKTQSWERRKEAVVAKLAGATRTEATLVIADEGYNLRDMVRGGNIAGERGSNEQAGEPGRRAPSPRQSRRRRGASPRAIGGGTRQEREHGSGKWRSAER